MNGTCGILVNKDRILLVKLSNESDWILPTGVIGEGDVTSAVIQNTIKDNLNIETLVFHSMRPFTKDKIVIFPHILKYISGPAETDKYIDLKFVDKSESKSVKIDRLYRDVVKYFFESYSILLKK